MQNRLLPKVIKIEHVVSGGVLFIIGIMVTNAINLWQQANSGVAESVCSKHCLFININNNNNTFLISCIHRCIQTIWSIIDKPKLHF